LLALVPQRMLTVSKSISALNILCFLLKILLQIVQYIQNVWILLMASKQTATLSEFRH
jgi:hypothetical protein